MTLEPTYDAATQVRYPATEVARWVKRLTVLTVRITPAPEKIAHRVGRGLHLLLYKGGRAYRHVELRPASEVPHAFARTATTAVRFAGDEPGPVERQWLKGVVAALQRVEREAGWTAFLDWAEARPSPSLPAWSEDKQTSGAEALIRLLEPCQAKCAFCSCRSRQPDMVAGIDEVAQRLEDAREAGFEQVTFTGGEPTLVKQLPAFVERAKALGFTKINLQTNGINLADRQLTATLAEAGLTHVLQSLHSHEASVHEAIFQIPGCFPKCVEAVHVLLEHGIIVGLNHVTTTQNVDGLTDYVRFVHETFDGTPYITFSLMSPQGWGVEHQELIPSITQFNAELRPALDLAGELGIDAHVPGLCGVPLCTLPGYEEHLIEYHEADPPEIATRTYVEGCQDCRWRSRCSGYWTDYFRQFGTDEIRPVARD